MAYRELAPPAEIEPYVACRWVRDPEPAARLHHIVPDACADIVWITGRRLHVAGPATGWRVVSNAKTMDASSAWVAPAKIAAMPTREQTRGSTPSCGAVRFTTPPTQPPKALPMVNMGASVPPDVPLPR